MPRKVELLRLTLGAACANWNINERTLSKRLKVSGIAPGPDRKFSVSQINAAVYGDMDGARLQKEQALAEKYRLQVEELKGELVRIDTVYRVWENLAISAREIVRGSSLSDTEKEDFLRQFRNLRKEDLVKQ